MIVIVKDRESLVMARNGFKKFIINTILAFNRNMKNNSAVYNKKETPLSFSFISKEYETNSTCLESLLLDGPSPNTSKQSAHQS